MYGRAQKHTYLNPDTKRNIDRKQRKKKKKKGTKPMCCVFFLSPAPEPAYAHEKLEKNDNKARNAQPEHDIVGRCRPGPRQGQPYKQDNVQERVQHHQRQISGLDAEALQHQAHKAERKRQREPPDKWRGLVHHIFRNLPKQREKSER